MGHSVGDALIVASLAMLLLGYLYFKHQTRIKRLELIHQERLVAMEKDFPLPELPMDPPPSVNVPDPTFPLVLGIVLMAFALGSMIVIAVVAEEQFQRYWITPLPIALIGLGILVAYRLTSHTRA